MPPRFEGPEMTIPGEVLTILRAIAGWRQKQLGIAAGLSDGDMVSAYETGKSALPLSRVQEFAVAMGLPPHQVELTMVFFEEARAAAGRHRAGGEAAVSPQTDAFAAGVGGSFGELARTTVEQAMAEAEYLDARRRAPGLW